MMMPPSGPTTSLMEDFSELGFVNEDKKTPDASVKQHKEPDEKGGDFAGPPGDKKPSDPGGDVDLDTGDAAAGHTTYVPARGDEDVGPKGKYGKARGGAKNEDVESTNGKMIPAFMIPAQPSPDEVAEQEEQLAEEAEKVQLRKAWDVINAYFSEDDDGLNEEGLRGVINALGHSLNVAVEDIAMLQGENVRLTEAVNDLNRLLKEADGNLSDGKKMAYPDEDKKNDEEDEEETQEESRRAPANLLEDASLNSILEEVASIGGSPKHQALAVQEKLIEGFETLAESATDILDRVVDVIRTDEGLAEDEEIELPEDDQRLKVAQYFYGIAEDAQNYLTRLADGDVAFRVAEEDLNRLHGDVQKGIDAMHKIPA